MALLPKPLPPYGELGELVVATRSGPTTYSTGEAGSVNGFEHDLMQLFAAQSAEAMLHGPNRPFSVPYRR